MKIGLIIVGAGLMGVALASASAIKIGELGIRESRLVKAHAARSFDVNSWRAADPTERGRMLADLARRHRFVGRHADSVEAWLGPSDCYADYDEVPCYRVGFSGQRHQMQLPVGHGDPALKVRRVSIVPAP